VNDALDISWVEHGAGEPRATLRLDGARARYRSLRDGERPHEVGTYATGVDGELADDLAAAATDLLDGRTAGEPRGLDVLRVSRPGVPHRFVDVTLGPLPEMAARVVETCLSRAAAAVQLHCEVVGIPGSPNAGLRLHLDATGAEDTAVLLRPRSISVRAGDGDPVWQAGDRGVVGLRGDDGRLLDGINTPALIPADRRASMLILDAEVLRTAPPTAVLVVEGLIHAPLEERVADTFPDDAFRLRANLRQ